MDQHYSLQGNAKEKKFKEDFDSLLMGSRYFIHKFTDTRSARGKVISKQLSDFMIIGPNNFSLILEYKFCTGDKFNFRSLNENQRSVIQDFLIKGIPYHVIIQTHKNTYLLDARILILLNLESKKSTYTWDEMELWKMEDLNSILKTLIPSNQS